VQVAHYYNINGTFFHVDCLLKFPTAYYRDDTEWLRNCEFLLQQATKKGWQWVCWRCYSEDFVNQVVKRDTRD